MQIVIRFNRKIMSWIGAVVLLGLVTVLAGCSTATGNDANATNNQLQKYQTVQPIHQYDWSQMRQTALDVNDAEVHGVATTTFFYNMGIANPIKTCPSIGYPMPSTTQLTNPLQATSGGPIGLMEPNGVYTGTSTGTFVICVHPNGKKEIVYWEGFVHAEGGPAHWDKSEGQVVVDGDPTVTANTK